MTHSVRSTAMFSLPLARLKGARRRFADKNVEMVSLSLKWLKTANTSLGQMKRADTLPCTDSIYEDDSCCSYKYIQFLAEVNLDLC